MHRSYASPTASLWHLCGTAVQQQGTTAGYTARLTRLARQATQVPVSDEFLIKVIAVLGQRCCVMGLWGAEACQVAAASLAILRRFLYSLPSRPQQLLRRRYGRGWTRPSTA